MLHHTHWRASSHIHTRRRPQSYDEYIRSETARMSVYAPAQARGAFRSGWWTSARSARYTPRPKCNLQFFAEILCSTPHRSPLLYSHNTSHAHSCSADYTQCTQRPRRELTSDAATSEPHRKPGWAPHSRVAHAACVQQPTTQSDGYGTENMQRMRESACMHAGHVPRRRRCMHQSFFSPCCFHSLIHRFICIVVLTPKNHILR